MQLSTSKRNLGKVAAILGIFQGLTWAGLSLAAIILYNWSPTLEDPTNYTSILGYLLYQQFLQGSDTTSNFIVRPLDFTIFMWIYFILSVGWAALSVDQFAAIHHNKNRQKVIIFAWGVVALITSLIDLIFTCLLARDYASCYDETDVSSGITLTSYFCYMSFGIVMTLAARGYTLWLVNVILAFNMLQTSTSISKDSKLARLFSNHSIPRVVIPRSTKADDSFPRGGDISPNFLNNNPSFLHTDKFDRDDIMPSPHRSSKYGSENNVPSFFSRGEKFSY